MAGQEDSMSQEEELLRRCARGDAAAYRELVERMEKPLVNFIFRFVGERHAAEDLFQETFVRVIRGLGEFRPDASLTTWIYTIARNLALDSLKARRRHREVSLDHPVADEGGRVIPFKDVLRSEAPAPAGRAEEAESEFRLVEALGSLTAAKREALALRVYAGLPYAEIARIVRAPVGTIKFRVHEALHDLSKRLGAAGSESAAQGG
jgi:RNA polymerase sigma-70 factor (ECF subfamily)